MWAFSNGRLPPCPLPPESCPFPSLHPGAGMWVPVHPARVRGVGHHRGARAVHLLRVGVQRDQGLRAGGPGAPGGPHKGKAHSLPPSSSAHASALPHVPSQRHHVTASRIVPTPRVQVAESGRSEFQEGDFIITGRKFELADAAERLVGKWAKITYVVLLSFYMCGTALRAPTAVSVCVFGVCICQCVHSVCCVCVRVCLCVLQVRPAVGVPLRVWHVLLLPVALPLPRLPRV